MAATPIVSFTYDAAGNRPALEEEQRQRVAEVGQLSQRLEDLAVGDLHLETIGIFWLLLGIVFTNIPNEVTMLLLWSAHIFR